MIRTMHKSGGGPLRIPRFGSAALACVVSALLWLAIVPAAWADSTPTLIDSTNSPPAAVNDTVTLRQGVYTEDLTNASTQDTWYDCNASAPTTPLGECVAIQAGGLSYQVTSDDQSIFPHNFIVVFESDSLLQSLIPTPSNSIQVQPPPTGPSPPVNTYAPAAIGATTVGSALTAVSGGWSGAQSLSYSWSRCASDGSNCVPVPSSDPTNNTYPLTDPDLGALMLLTQMATGAGGTQSAHSQLYGPITTSAGTVPAPALTAGTGKPALSGSPQVDATVNATPVTLSNNPSYAYQWMRCGAQCTSITGAITTAYTPTAADLGHTLMFVETATNAGGQTPAQSEQTAVVTAPTETTLQVSSANVTAGQPATLIATVTSATGQAPPAGAVTFELGGTQVAGCASVTTHPSGASATVTCQTVLAGSASAASAVFAPAPGSYVTGSSSASIGFVLGRAATAATMSLPAYATVGKRLTLTAKVAPQPGTKGVSPTGTVVFLDGKKSIKGCAPALDNGVARCAVTYKALGKHSIAAVYLGDGNFSGSGTHVHKLQVVVPKPAGYVSSLMTWTFLFRPHYTRVATLSVTGVEPGLTIAVGCSGHGCPKHRYRTTVTRAACGKHGTCKNVNLAKHFDGRKLGVGARLTVRLTHPGWLGKYYSFVVRHGHKPKIDTACLAVGQTKPGAGCTPR
jgi:Bacterial Ig-like domain (group 3)